MTSITEQLATHGDLLTRPVYCHLGFARPDGSVQVNPMWFTWDGSRIRMTTTTTRAKYRAIMANAAVAISVNDPDQPYRYLELRGTVDQATPDPEAAFFLELADRYGLVMDGPPSDAADRVVLSFFPHHASSQ